MCGQASAQRRTYLEGGVQDVGLPAYLEMKMSGLNALETKH